MRSAKKYLLMIVFAILIISIFAIQVYAGDNTALQTGYSGSESVEALKDAIKISPNDAALYVKLGRVYNEKHEYELAIRYLDLAVQMGVSAFDVAYDIGYSNRFLGYYDEAIKVFNAVINKDDVKAKAHLELGYCYLKTMKYKEATSSLDKAIGYDDSLLSRAKLYKGMIKYQQGNYDDAISLLRQSLSGTSDFSTVISAKNYMAAAKSASRKDKRFMLIESFSLIYDDNIVTASDTEAVMVSDKADFGGIEYLRAAYYPIKSAENMLLLSYMYYHKFYFNLNKYNLEDHNAIVSYTRALDSSKALSFKYNYDYYSLESKRYFQRNRFAPALKIKESKNAHLEVNALAENKEYFGETSFSSTNYGGGFSQSLKFGLATKASFAFNYNKEETRNRDYEYSGQKYALLIDQPFYYGINISLSGEFYRKLYSNTHSAYKKKREDDVKTMTCGLQKSLTDSLSSSLRYYYRLNDSNIKDYEYDRSISVLEIKYIF
ncbi:tetratricopeptide repeat protein [Thermodesulfobacteriota bacterium]